MYVGTQYFGTSRTEMEFLVRHGVNHFDASVADMEVDTLRRYREEAAAYGVELEMVHVKPMLNVTMANDPERDREIDGFCRYIENASQAGLRGLNYNFCVLNAEGKVDSCSAPGVHLAAVGRRTAPSSCLSTTTRHVSRRGRFRVSRCSNGSPTFWNGSSPSLQSTRCSWRATSMTRRARYSMAWRSGTGRSLKG